ncbi:MAG: alpha/beta fold hydrolase [Polymorphobacter sp.]
MSADVLKPPLLFIHGYWSTPATFARLQARFEAAGYQVIAPALPLHDRDPSLPPPAELGTLTVEDYARFLVGELEKLGAPPVIIGHSMGGMLAQIVAARVPHAGLVLLSTAGTATTLVPALATVRTMAGVMLKWGWWEAPTMIAEGPAMWGIYNGVPDSIARAEYAAHVWDSGRVMAEMTLPNLSATGATKVDYKRLDRPALVIVGTEDRTTVAGISRATARKLAGTVDYHELPGVGHWLFWGETEVQVGDWMATWLEQFEPAVLSSRA